MLFFITALNQQSFQRPQNLNTSHVILYPDGNIRTVSGDLNLNTSHVILYLAAAERMGTAAEI